MSRFMYIFMSFNLSFIKIWNYIKKLIETHRHTMRSSEVVVTQRWSVKNKNTLKLIINS